MNQDAIYDAILKLPAHPKFICGIVPHEFWDQTYGIKRIARVISSRSATYKGRRIFRGPDFWTWIVKGRKGRPDTSEYYAVSDNWLIYLASGQPIGDGVIRKDVVGWV